MARRTIFSSESVTAGHPDKICDQISDDIVDAFLYLDPEAEVSAECAVATGLVFLAVNCISPVSVDLTGIAREVIADIGYTEAHGFDPDACSVITSVSHRSQTPATEGKRESSRPTSQTMVASNQASVFGFACGDTPERMPVPITLARRLAQQLDEVRRQKALPIWLPTERPWWPWSSKIADRFGYRPSSSASSTRPRWAASARGERPGSKAISTRR